MRKLLLLAAGAAPLALAGQANADEQVTVSAEDGYSRFYAQADIGVATSVKVGPFDADGGLILGGALGLRLNEYIRVQAEARRVEAEAMGGIATGDAVTYGGSVFLDLPIGDHLTISGGGGLEYADGHVTYASVYSTDSDGDGWHYAFEGAYELNSRASLVFGYRNTSLDFDGMEIDTDGFTAGLRLGL